MNTVIYEVKNRAQSSHSWIQTFHLLVDLDKAFRMYQAKIILFKGTADAKKQSFGEFLDNMKRLGYRIV